MYVNYTLVYLILKKNNIFCTILDETLLPDQLEYIYFSIWLILILGKTDEFIYLGEEFRYPWTLIQLWRMVKAKNSIAPLRRGQASQRTWHRLILYTFQCLWNYPRSVHSELEALILILFPLDFICICLLSCIAFK